jgi:hypothetical protein
MYQQLWGYKVEEKLYLGVREQKSLNTTALMDTFRTRLVNTVRTETVNLAIFHLITVTAKIKNLTTIPVG